MSLVYHASLVPSKLELVEQWLPTRQWADGRTIAAKVAEYRFDDPDGEVGVETIVWRADDGALLQTPLTYRAEPLDGAATHLIGTTDHSVLGRRYVYDGCGDPVWALTVATAILTGGSQSQMYFLTDGERVDVPPRMQVRGSGSDLEPPTAAPIESVTDEGSVTLVATDRFELLLVRVLGTPVDAPQTLTGSIGDDPTVLALAGLRPR